MIEDIDKRWLYLDALRVRVKTKLKGDPSLGITSQDISDLEDETKLGKATLQRFFGTDSSDSRTYPNTKTRNIFAIYVNYKNYNLFVKDYIKHIVPKNAHTAILPKVPLPTDHPIAPYLSPCIDMMTSFAFRLKEIFEGRGLFLLKDAPQTDFNEYRYISTIYRFCAVLAWVRIVKKEQSFSRIQDDYQKSISKAIYNFQNALADGKEVEALIAKDLCKMFCFNTSKWSEKIWVNIGIEIDNILHTYRHQHMVIQLLDLDIESQNKLLDDICEKISQIGKVAFKKQASENNIAIAQIARKQAWIYFDWQTAIGDIMIERTNRPQKAYEVIGFADFESYFLDDTFKNKRWIKRAEKPFADFDITRSESLDARILQLKNVFKHSVKLIEVFILLQNGSESPLPQYIEKLKNNNF
ncbi:MAG: hypothetical protein ACPG5B_07450 [Chitinophagales bacterium]